MTDRELMQQALEAFVGLLTFNPSPAEYKQGRDVVAALRDRLAQPEQEPVAWMYDFLNTDNREEVIRDWITQDLADIEREKGFNVRPLYTTPPQRPWVGLTMLDMAKLRMNGLHTISDKHFKTIEETLKEKNNK